MVSENLTASRLRAHVSDMTRYFVIGLLLVAPVAASAGSVFLNGVNIDGVANQVFQNCTVTIDAQGNIHITAKGYAVGAPGATAPPPVVPGTPPAAQVQPAALPAAGLSARYWLVTEKAAPGMSQYDVDLFINSKFVRKFLDDEEHVVMELTKYLQTGQNKLVFVAKKNIGTVRRSSSPQHYFRIVIGEGDSGGRNVMIHRKDVDYKRTALETKDFTDEFFITGR
jgi:hypothetical protein